MDIFCSTIIPTINRATLSRAVCSVLDQDFRAAGFEVIVVNDSGQPLPIADWQHSEQVQVINTNHRERSVARNTGAAIAKGKYLHFLDDDDLILPESLNALWALHQTNRAAWLYGSYQTVDNEGHPVAEFQPNLNGNIFAWLVAGEAIPLQTSLIDNRQFFAAGAFDPQIVGAEDRDLGRRIALHGDFAFTPTIIAKIRVGEQGSTTDWTRLAEDDRWGREKALREQAAFARLRSSANTAYLHGRTSRAYFASMYWNLKRKYVLAASGRAAAGLVFTGWHIFQPNFWDGMRTKIK